MEFQLLVKAHLYTHDYTTMIKVRSDVQFTVQVRQNLVIFGKNPDFIFKNLFSKCKL